MVFLQKTLSEICNASQGERGTREKLFLPKRALFNKIAMRLYSKDFHRDRTLYFIQARFYQFPQREDNGSFMCM